MKTCIALALVCIFLNASNLISQTEEGWRVYTPADGSFSVELPIPLRQVESFSGEHNASLDRSQGYKWASSYAAIETTPEDSRFGIIVINSRNRIRLRLGVDDYWYLAAIMIGNEDEPNPTSANDVTVNGLTGQEYVYTKGGVTTRGRIFETGSKIYVVVFIGHNEQDLRSSDAERFLNSFRVRPAVRTKRAAKRK